MANHTLLPLRVLAFVPVFALAHSVGALNLVDAGSSFQSLPEAYHTKIQDIPPCTICSGTTLSGYSDYTKFSLPCAFQSFQEELWRKWIYVTDCAEGLKVTCSDVMLGGCGVASPDPGCPASDCN